MLFLVCAQISPQFVGKNVSIIRSIFKNLPDGVPTAPKL